MKSHGIRTEMNLVHSGMKLGQILYIQAIYKNI